MAMDEAIEWARKRISAGWQEREVIEELVSSGYDRETARHVVGRAMAGVEAVEEHGSRRWLVPAALVLLLVAGGGAVALNPGLATGVMDALPVGGGQPSLTDLAEKRGTYRVDYTITERTDENDSMQMQLSTAGTEDWTVKRMTADGFSQEMEVSAHTYRDTGATVICGDTLRSVFDFESEGPTCTQTSLWSIILPLFVTSPRPFVDDIDAVNISYGGTDTVNDVRCERFTVGFDLRHLYDEMLSDAMEQEADSANGTIPGTAHLCLDAEAGFAVETTLTASETRNSSLDLTSNNITLRAASIERGGDVSARPPEETVLTADCPDSDGGGVGHLIMFATDASGATLSTNGENRTVELPGHTNEWMDLTADDVQDGENTFTLYAGGDAATATCTYGSTFLDGNYSFS